MSKNISLAKDVYREFCEKQGFDLPVFFQDWWLDIVCGKDDWRIAMYVEDPNVVAVMTYYVKRKFFFEYITMPSLTKFMGPYFLNLLSRNFASMFIGLRIIIVENFNVFIEDFDFFETSSNK